VKLFLTPLSTLCSLFCLFIVLWFSFSL
jgi:hypothetical protein